MVGTGGVARFVPGGSSLKCAIASDELGSNGFRPGVELVDLLSIDIEGAEANVLRCLPLDSFRVHAVLIEVNKHAIEVNKHERETLSLWFLRRGYVLEQAFLHSAPWNQQMSIRSPAILDHLYVRRPRAAVYPPGMEGLPALDNGANEAVPPKHDISAGCRLFSGHVGGYCHRWRHWLPVLDSVDRKAWSACGAF